MRNHPTKTLRFFADFLACLPVSLRYRVLAIKKPGYWYGLLNAATLAQRLGIQRITAIEFGVAEGRGLLYLEDIAQAITKRCGVEIDLFGFGTVAGMPAPIDYRDLPYMWREGMFPMDHDTLEQKLTRAKLILGNVEQTTQSFFADSCEAPVGFLSFDLDYYSSTKSALEFLRKAGADDVLPRVFCCFDDVVGPVLADQAILCEYVGQPLAIKEFNDENTDMKLGELTDLTNKFLLPCQWHKKMYVLHYFRHPLYTKRIEVY